MAEEELKDQMLSSEYCKIHCQLEFLPRTLAMKALWAIIGVSLTLIGSSVTYAMSTSSQVTRITIMAEQSQKDITELKAINKSVDEKLNTILDNVRENGKYIKGMASTTP